MKKHLKTEGKTDTWITPKYITEALGEFDLDPCAHTSMPWHHAKTEFTTKEDGLKQDWLGRVWLNPPFNRYQIGCWMEKMSKHKNGVMLIPAATETRRFYKYVWKKASGILFMDHRPFFVKPSGKRGSSNSGQAMCLIAYDEINLNSLVNSNLGVVVTPINA